jgi:hypothetical protein
MADIEARTTQTLVRVGIALAGASGIGCPRVAQFHARHGSRVGVVCGLRLHGCGALVVGTCFGPMVSGFAFSGVGQLCPPAVRACFDRSAGETSCHAASVGQERLPVGQSQWATHHDRQCAVVTSALRILGDRTCTKYGVVSGIRTVFKRDTVRL